jgi:putative tryptophan/tyrosine transport system substrate-binding protein
MMRRREFITALGGAAAAAWPLAARAQQPVMPVIGFLHPGSAEPNSFILAAFRRGLSETGYVEGRNVVIEYRWAQDNNDRLPALAADLVRYGVNVIATSSSSAAALAAKAATTTVPIVFGIGIDPVGVGLVSTFNRPGGNATGVVSMNAQLGQKRLGLMRELLPQATRFGLLVNPGNPTNADILVRDLQAVAIDKHIEVVRATTVREIDAAFASLSQQRIDALLVTPDALFSTRRVQLATLATRHAIPVIYSERIFTEAGGLMSFGSNVVDRERQVGIYTGRILKGEKPADLPIQRASKFEFTVNLTTARALGLDFPPTLLALADEVIE